MEEIRAIFASVDILALITFHFQLGEITDIVSLQHPEMNFVQPERGITSTSRACMNEFLIFGKPIECLV
jgi:hypothetical protein